MASQVAPCPSCGRDIPDEALTCPYCQTRWDTSTRDDQPPAPGTLASAGTQSVPQADAEDRYAIVNELGQGGMGTVYLAFDRRLRRHVAYKVLRTRGGPDERPDADSVARFVSECQAAAQIEHPSIVPIYDFGQRREDGRAFFTMKYIEGRTLGDHILALRNGDAEPGVTRFRLLQILHQVMLAVSYMHRKRVLHRDIKPGNVMVGQFGEVFLVDFGLHKVRGRAVTTIRSDAGDDTMDSVIQGTPAYMPPEQVADPEAVDETSDQWALGAVLYEILTFRPPHIGPVNAIWARALDGTFPKPSETDPDVPRPLEEICLRAMAKRRHERFPSVKDMADKLQEFLDGEKELAHREQIGADALREARAQLGRYTDLEREAANLEKQHVEARASLPRDASPEDRARVTRMRERQLRMQELAEEAFPGVTQAYVRAIDTLPSNRVAREELSDLAFRRFLEAERAGKKGEMRLLRAMVESYHDGRYAEQLKGDGALLLASDPPGAHVYLASHVTSGSRLTLDSETYLGSTPTARVPLAMGSYLATLRREGYPDTLFPFLVDRNLAVEQTVRLLPADQLAPGFIYVPAGPFLKGGDPFRPEVRMERADLPGFCIARHPVTVEDYLAYINALASAEGTESALRRAPRTVPQPASPEGYYLVRRGDVFELPPRDAEGDEWLPRWPVISISAHDAEAYCAWRSKADGRPYRLPSSEEWEKAARGADGRLYVWGNGWEEGLSHSLTERSRRAPEPVDQRPGDLSPFGMQGAAGNVREWTSTTRPGSDGLRTLRGGSFSEGELVAQIAAMAWTRSNEVASDIGFRMAYMPTSRP